MIAKQQSIVEARLAICYQFIIGTAGDWLYLPRVSVYDALAPAPTLLQKSSNNYFIS
ncbi:hypothetical protein LJC11_03235 [Bacteroidales bacterium OttesenSCG-928-I21]|nr:hypothetical protein [Bacteroidales bacterium OttesenSCG-928-I21]